jgi:hypothetical protein
MGKATTAVRVCLLAAVCLMSSCGLLSDGPGTVLKNLYKNCNAGEYSKAEISLSADERALLHSQEAVLNGGVKGVCDQATRNGTLSSVEVIKEDVRGEGASVSYRKHFKDGSVTNANETLIKENGKWVLALGQ